MAQPVNFTGVGMQRLVMIQTLHFNSSRIIDQLIMKEEILIIKRKLMVLQMLIPLKKKQFLNFSLMANGAKTKGINVQVKLRKPLTKVVQWTN